ncbi:hypothetical protein W97_04425 [Coniosporium apollinis CBS 100218]|uniref:Uncharacterized protein n=1 Tax=Coniosporium apollinis (strain CBS 100218) TaxID=1168221 RepID=R7YTM1_CONA1|nr:uncharacterized protein W97_04425 [Coniosporium apollinis CBS 100218]EON65188.1 hypothetical protein W97_04425 [Coniosporium apollinis CBS 100218]
MNSVESLKIEHLNEWVSLGINTIEAFLVDWQVIFTHCDPSMLFALKSVKREFRKLPGYEGTWKKCRLNNYGEDIPPPPAGLKEYQYLDPLDGQKDCMSWGHKGLRIGMLIARPTNGH